MSRYLVIAHQTADSPQLLSKLLDISAGDLEAEFQVLAPIRPVSISLMLGGEHRSPREIAWWRARRTERRLEQAGLTVIGARPGLRDPWLGPVERIEHELRYHGPYRGVIVSTLPHPVSDWLHRDVPHRLARRHPELQVWHVTAPDWFHLDADGAGAGVFGRIAGR